ncbi:MAG: type II toxin-antitoxin system Phd/YefM family antitoxin [Lentisphaeraceae bacterium]|nr:type II toxin-antitoxin system Phd/YefM family antitoxin [Lentisphaeraceae bacterium]
MKTYTANDAKQSFGLVIDEALQEPVTITRHGRPVVVITSEAEYKEFVKLKEEKLKAEVQKGFYELDNGNFSNRTVEEIAEEAL